MSKSVIVVEDDRGLREQLTEILNSSGDVKCIGAYRTGEEALKKVPAQMPDVVLMDIGLPGMSGIQCVAELRRVVPALRIIMVTVHEDTNQIFKALKAGASGYLSKSSPPEQLIEAVRDVYKGGSPMSSHIARKIVDHFHSAKPSPTETENLTQREREVLHLVARGLVYKEIANELNISITTVRSHIINICEKLHVRNRIEAVAKLRANL